MKTLDSDLSKGFINQFDLLNKFKNRQFVPSLIGSYTIRSLNEYLIDEQDIQDRYKNCKIF